MSKRKSGSLWNVGYSSRDPTGLDGVVFRTMPCLCSHYRHFWWTSWDYLSKVFESDPIPREKSRIRPQICRQAWKKDRTWPRRRHWGESGKVWEGLEHLHTCSKATRMSIQAWVIHMRNNKPHSRQRVTEVPATVNTIYILVDFGTFRTVENL